MFPQLVASWGLGDFWVKQTAIAIWNEAVREIGQVAAALLWVFWC